MAALGDPRDKAKTCILMFHDLLGFGSLISSSCGTLDSSVGEVAYQRILNLKKSIESVKQHFPEGTRTIHFNDSACSVLDVNIEIGSQLIDPSGVAMSTIKESDAKHVINFLGASAKLHQVTLSSEEEHRLGAGGRTFVVVGKRWVIDEESVDNLEYFQANLAFSEAYIADTIGSSAGLNNRCFENLYVNDYLWFILECARNYISAPDLNHLDKLGVREVTFPKCLLQPDSKNPHFVNIFYRKRKFYSLMSHHTCDLDI